uniref:Survival protein SurE-like phosphatase/nucleotidase domain-containing protein n=1 Tax=Tetradesmus obliquus TaxID=3088 RepID=A0A383W782_TETOB|eukprot:jgi/Sobl393_1/16098/SZX60523.1
MAASNGRLPRVLVSNDDGISAPGLRELVLLLSQSGCCDVYVCAPSGERSAQSHAITLGRYLQCYPSEVPGAAAAFAVDGTPADAVMLALNSPVFEGITFDLVASGINRGDNCGLHVIYSGTVGAAREAACKGVPAMALSLADHKAKQQQHYTTPAALAVALIQATLEGLTNGCAHHSRAFEAGCVINVNFPAEAAAAAAAAAGQPAGLALTHQGTGCVFPKFLEVTEPTGPHLPEVDEHTPNLRVFRNYAGAMRDDDSEGSDNWAVSNGWVSVTPLLLRQDVPLRLDATCAVSSSAREAVASIVELAAQKAQLAVRGPVKAAA